ncbi:MAG: STAS domain-containing protein [candidate division KSB1 bacterium]|nr:STAS domain-containing protein [candidate division KSB1 bacterium]
MNFFLEEVNGIKIIKLKEQKLDSNVAPDLKAQFLVLIGKGKQLILDLSNVNYSDSSGLGAILLGFRLARDNNADFAICGVQERVKKLIQIAQLEHTIRQYQDHQSAIKAMQMT